MRGERCGKPGPCRTVLVAVAFGLCLMPVEASDANTPDRDESLPTGSGAAREPPKLHGFARVGRDASYLFSRPFHLDRSGRRRAAAVLGTTAVLYVFREDIRNFAQSHRSDDLERILDGARTMGKGGFAPSLALLSYLASFATHNDREKETAQLLLESMGFSAAVAGIGQFVIASERPEEGNDVHFFRTGGHGVSADAALAASVIPPIRRQYLRIGPSDPWSVRVWKRAATVLLYAGASLTAYQRIYDDKHWAPDAFLGVATGLLVGETLCDAHDRDRSRAPALAITATRGGILLGFRISLPR